MNEQTAKQLIRQLKLMNFWISFYGIIMIVVLGVMVYLMVQLVGFVQESSRRVESLREGAVDSVNLKKQLCEGEGTVSDVIKSQTEWCR